MTFGIKKLADMMYDKEKEIIVKKTTAKQKEIVQDYCQRGMGESGGLLGKLRELESDELRQLLKVRIDIELQLLQKHKGIIEKDDITRICDWLQKTSQIQTEHSERQITQRCAQAQMTGSTTALLKDLNRDKMVILVNAKRELEIQKGQINLEAEQKKREEEKAREQKSEVKENKGVEKEGDVAKENKRLKAFVSYSSKDKLIGAKVKDILNNFSVDGFLAHNDISVSEEWKQRIREELSKSDIFISLLSNDFKKSDWAPQEVGIAYFRDILIIPLRLNDIIPYGFINHLQGKPITIDNIPLNHLIKPIVDKFPRKMVPAVIKELEKVHNFRYAESVMELLILHFNNFRQTDIDKFVDISIPNGQIWSARLCRNEYLPQFIAINRKKIKPDRLRVLLYQIEKDEWDPESKERIC